MDALAKYFLILSDGKYGDEVCWKMFHQIPVYVKEGRVVKS